MKQQFKYQISPEGPLDAKIAVVCEKPAEEESAQNRLLVGVTGRMVRRHLRGVGLHAGIERWEADAQGVRHIAEVTPSRDVFLTNAVQRYDDPTANPTVQDIIREQPRLFSELARLRNLRCIVAMGNIALAAVGNFAYSQVNKDGDPTGILQYRGSVLPIPGLSCKMVPTVHPSFYVRGEWRYRSIVSHDIQRAAEQLSFHEIQRKQRTLHIEPGSLKEALGWIEAAAEGQYLEHDLETFQWPRKKTHIATGKRVDSGIWYISCVGFSNDPSEGWCIPITRNNREPYWDVEQEAIIWQRLQWLFNLPYKIYTGQNQLFDLWHERRNTLTVRNTSQGLDSMYMHRLRAPDLPHDLGFLTSIYTDPPEPYYKNESGKWEAEITVPEKQFWRYNCKDASLGLEVTLNIKKDLESTGQFDYYMRYMQPQVPVLLDMQVRGMHIDTTRLERLRKECKNEIAEREENLWKDIGWRPNTKSPIDMSRLLDQFGIRYKRTEKAQRARIREEDLFTYAHNYPDARDALRHCIGITQRRTLLSNFLYPALDTDDFYHPSYDLSHAKNGRLSSEGADEGGFQAQNLPSYCRLMVVPDDDDCELTKADLAQADNRCVVWDAGDSYAMDCFKQGLNMHRVRAATIFRGWQPSSGLPSQVLLDSIEKLCPVCTLNGVKDCSHSQYFISKQGGHATNYGMGARHWIEDILPPFDLWLELDEAQRILGLCRTRAIRLWQDNTFEQLCQSPWLESPCGRKREFYGYPGSKPDAKIHRDALSWKGSVCVGHVTNLAMVRLYGDLQPIPKARIVTQTHDSLLVNHRRCDRDVVWELINKAFYCPLNFHNNELLIPVEMSAGPSWGEA